MRTAARRVQAEIALPTSHVTLPDGQRVTVRPVGRRDRRRLRRSFVEQGDDRCHLGILAGSGRRDARRSEGFFRLDPPLSVFYVAVMGREWEERIVGICGWRAASSAAGEVEVVIGLLGDPAHSRGVGKALLDQVGAAAAQFGITRLRSYILPEDLELQDVFEHSGISVSTDFSRGCYEYSMRPMPAAA